MRKFIHNIIDVLYLFKPYWKYHKKFAILLIVVFALLPSITTVGSVLYQQTVLDALSDGRDLWYIFVTILWILGIIYLPQIVEDLFDIFVSTLTIERAEAEIRRDTYRKAKATDFIYFDNPEFYNNYTWTINEHAGKAEEARKMMVRLFSLITTLFSVVGLIVAQDWLIVVINVVMLFANTCLGFVYNKISHSRREETLLPYRKLSYINRIFYVKDWAAGIKVMGVAEKLFCEFDRSYIEIFSAIKKYRWKFAACRLLVSALNFTDEIAVVMYLCYLITSDRIAIGSFVGLLAASSYLRNSLHQLFGFIQTSNQLSYFAERLKRFEQLESPIEGSREDKASISSEEAAKSFDVEFADVCFSYPGSNFKIDRMSFRIEKGQKIAFVGENGGGKTTLTKLLLRLYDPQSGEILINGKDIRKYDIGQLRQYIGVSLQEAQVFAMSLRDNLTLYHQADNKELQEICREYGLESVLVKANASLDSQMTREFNENGILLSGGEKQKLALARLAVGDFGLLVLDEPSAALDPIAEYELNKIIFDKASTATTIMISHRFSNVRDADCIYVVKNGAIVESGTHNELVSQKGYYYEMFTKQSEKYVQ